MATTLTVVVCAVPAALLAGHWWGSRLALRAVQQQLDALHRQMTSWQGAHDHQVESIDRRMQDIEAAAARAENEARMVSMQLADMNDSMAARIGQVEHRLELEVIAGRYRPGSPLGAGL